MSSDESLTRLQNALATLAEMAARSQEVDAQHGARLSSLEESNRHIAETNRHIAETNKRIAETNRDLAESNQMIVEMLRRHDEQFDDLRATGAETDQKLAALVDAQIRAEDEMNKVREVLAELAVAMANLTKKVGAITGGRPPE